MQFYLDGYYPGDPFVLPADPASAARSAAPLPDEVDVLIVGTGPAGLLLAAQLSRFPEITTRIVERREGPLELGQADGIACRTVEMLHAFGVSETLLKESYWVNETVFWKPAATSGAGIVRGGRVRDVEEGLSEFPHVIVNQARVHSYLLDVMERSPSRLRPDYGLAFAGLEIDRAHSHPVRVELASASDPDAERTVVRAKYVVGSDGARSGVRAAIGRTLQGDAANQAWGVMDVLAVTDFPDIRFKTAIQSEHGNILIIPREGGHLVRLYVELDALESGERIASRGITIDALIEKAQTIMAPYTLDVKEVPWWSAYEIGQRVTDGFADDEDDPRVFLAGDACHTHSPKAGQGMNVSMQDTFNLGWKLAAVLRGRSSAELLRSYSAERQAMAQGLIDFDRDWAKMFSAPPAAPGAPAGSGVTPEEFARRFQAAGRYTAGVATVYRASSIVGPTTHQHLATGFPIGERFHSAPVLRLADARPMHLGHVAEADGRWLVHVFADGSDPVDATSRVGSLLQWLAHDPQSPVVRATPEGADPDAVIDVRAIFPQSLHELTPELLPASLRPRKGRHGLIDAEKAFCVDRVPGADITQLRGIAPEGCVVVVRPDQYVAHVLPLGARDELAEFFAGVLLDAR